MSKLVEVVFAGREEGFRGLSIGMSASEIQAIERKKGTLDGDILSLDLDGDQSLAVTFEDGKSSEIRYSLELADHTGAKAAFVELAAVFVKRHGKPTSVKKSKMQSWNVDAAKRVYITCYEKKGSDVIGEPDKGVVQVIVDPYPE
jgi:hypothetical protein